MLFGKAIKSRIQPGYCSRSIGGQSPYFYQFGFLGMKDRRGEKGILNCEGEINQGRTRLTCEKKWTFARPHYEKLSKKRTRATTIYKTASADHGQPGFIDHKSGKPRP